MQLENFDFIPMNVFPYFRRLTIVILLSSSLFIRRCFKIEWTSFLNDKILTEISGDLGFIILLYIFMKRKIIVIQKPKYQ